MTKKVQMLVCIILCAVCLSSCAMTNGYYSLLFGGGKPNEKTKLVDYLLTIIDDGETYYIYLETKDGEAFFSVQAGGSLRYTDVPVDITILDEINALVWEYNVLDWDGFDGGVSVNGGFTFSLTLIYANGYTMTASGGDTFPEGYDEFDAAVFDCLREHIDIFA